MSRVDITDYESKFLTVREHRHRFSFSQLTGKNIDWYPCLCRHIHSVCKWTQLMEHHEEEIDVGGVHDMLSRAILIDGKAAEREDYV